MPLMVLSHKSWTFVYKDVRSLPNLNVNFKAPCWGWGVLESDPIKFWTRKKDKDGHERKIFTVRAWLNLGVDAKGESQHIRVNMYDVYAEGCQYLVKGDPVHFEGTLRFDKFYSDKKHYRYWMVDAQMVIPPYSADGREFCARKNALQERENAEMLARFTDKVTGEFLPGQDMLEAHLKGERSGNI